MIIKNKTIEKSLRFVFFIPLLTGVVLAIPALPLLALVAFIGHVENRLGVRLYD